MALCGALAGWLLKVFWDDYKVRQRWKRLAPLILRQIGGAAGQCATAFDATALPRHAAKLNAAQATAIEMVALGVGGPAWTEGLGHLSDTIDALQAAEAAPTDHRGGAMEALRRDGAALQRWVEGMGGRVR